MYIYIHIYANPDIYIFMYVHIYIHANPDIYVYIYIFLFFQRLRRRDDKTY